MWPRIIWAIHVLSAVLLLKDMSLKLLAHVRNVHALFDSQRLVLCCGQGACPSSFSSFYSFWKHIVKRHADLNERYVEEGLQNEYPNMDDEVPLGNGDAIGDNDGMDVDDHDGIENDEDFGKIIKKTGSYVFSSNVGTAEHDACYC